jgi:thiamine kinase-like enzyme
MCLVHGDVNPGNILAPRAEPGRIYLIDRQPFDWSLIAWLGVSDLAYLLCSFWPEETRRRFELPILRHYHAALAARGVAGYSWERLWDDYRLCAVQSVYVAVEWCVLAEDRERMRWLWTLELRRAMAAFAELRCRELWRG